MSAPRIRLQPRKTSPPHPASLPVGNARQWLSSYEDEKDFKGIPIFLTQSAFTHAAIHAASEPDYEVGGVLLGKRCRDVEGGQEFVVVETVLPARFTKQGSVFLTFTQDSLVDIHAKMDRYFPGKEMVGWYHTHPRMGVFLSNYDTWLHDHFFPESWQVALVIEPHTDMGGFFIRQLDGTLDPERYFGFYELDGNIGHSVVHWQNLEHREEPSPEGD